MGSSSSVNTLILPIKGMYYEEGGKLLRRRLLPQTNLNLRPVHTNPESDWHDDFAVGVFFEETRIGWVPRTHSRIVRRLLDSENIQTCKVWRVGTDAKLRWTVSMHVLYAAESEETQRLESVMSRMMVPSAEYAKLIISMTKQGTQAELDFIDAYNDGCFHGD